MAAPPMFFHADSIVATLLKGPAPDDLAWCDIRDICDQRTGGELDCLQLDILADMVRARIMARTARRAAA